MSEGAYFDGIPQAQNGVETVDEKMRAMIEKTTNIVNALKENPTNAPSPEYIKTHKVEEVRDIFKDSILYSEDPHEYLVMMSTAAKLLGKPQEKVYKDLRHELDHFKGFTAVMKNDSDTKKVGFGIIMGYDPVKKEFGWKPFFIHPDKSKLSDEDMYLILEQPEKKSPRDLTELSNLTNV